MLPASDLTAIITNLSALKLGPDIAAAVLGAVLAPLYGARTLRTRSRERDGRG